MLAATAVILFFQGPLQTVFPHLIFSLNLTSFLSLALYSNTTYNSFTYVKLYARSIYVNDELIIKHGTLQFFLIIIIS